MGQTDSASHVPAPLRDFRRPHGRAAAGTRSPSPQRPCSKVSRLRISELDDEPRLHPVNPLSVVEPLAHQADDVRHGLRRILGERFERKVALHRLDGNDRRLNRNARPRRPLGNGQTGERRHRQQDGPGVSDGAHPASRWRAGAGRETPTRGHIGASTHAPHRGRSGRQTFWPQVTR